MAYNIYTPMQRAAVPTSIFSQAMERGAKMGTIIDSPETAKLKGELLGKEKALDMQMKRENIESANINQEAARVGIARQEEALEADKRANDLAPIKEGMAIAGGAMNLISGVQSIMGNSNKLELQEQAIELNNIKLDTQAQNASIINDTATQVALNDNAKSKLEASHMRITSEASKAMSEQDPAARKTALAQLVDSTEFQSLSIHKPENALTILESAKQSGAISEDQYWARADTINSAELTKIDTANRKAELARQRKFEEELDGSIEATDNTLGKVIGAQKETGVATLEDYRKIKMFPEGRYVEKDGKIDFKAAPDDKSEDAGGAWVAAWGDSGEIIQRFESGGEEIAQHLYTVQRGYNAQSYRQRMKAEQAGMTRGPNGEWVKINQSKQQGGAPTKLPDAGLLAAKQRLQDVNIAPTQEVGKVEEGSGGWYRRLKTVANKVFPWIDNLSEGDVKTAKNAARNIAKQTIDTYKSASPEEKEDIKNQIKANHARTPSPIGMPLEEEGFLESILENKFKGSKTRLADSMKRGYAKDPNAGLNFLSDMMEYQIKNDMETVFEKSMEVVPPAAKRASKEEAANAQKLAGAKSHTTPGDAVDARNSYNAIKNRGKVKNEEEPEEVVKRIQPALKEIKSDAGWTDSKAASVQKTVVNVESSPILTSETPQIKAIAAVESGGNPSAVSRTGVQGLMQVTEDTADALNERYGTRHSRTTPEGSLALSKLLLNELVSKKLYAGNKHLIYAAYNAGEPAIDLAIELANNSTDWRVVRLHLYDALKALHSAGRYKVNPRNKSEETSKYPDDVIRYEELFNQLA